MTLTPNSASIAAAVATTTTAFNLTGKTGDFIVLTIGHQAGALTVVTDNAGNTYAKAADTMDAPTSATAQKRVAIYYCLSSIGAVTQVTVTCATGSAIGVGVDIYTPNGTMSLVNAVAGASTATHPAAVTPTSAAGDSIFGGIAYTQLTAGTRLETLDSGNYTETAGLNPASSTTRISRANDLVSVGTNQAGPQWTFTSGTSASVTASFRETITNAAPTANAGVDQTVEPFTTVTLTGSGTDTDGTIASYAWTQTSGTTVTLAGSGNTRTFTSPASISGDTLVFSLIVTDDDGATSTADTVSVIVLPATEFYLSSAGVWTPMLTTQL